MQYQITKSSEAPVLELHWLDESSILGERDLGKGSSQETETEQ
jgi:hypothetical protein